ncbi:MAG TPA: protease modulator HflC [Alphaproteobacteria bacterium]|nr:protease modulator HflC [Alphaproteobacteria bacterium]
MNRTLGIALAIVLVILGLAAYGSFFTVHESQQAMVLQFGEPKRVVRDPGLHFKVPFVQNVVSMEKRILDFDAPPVEAVAADKKRIVVDAYARFKIDDPLRYYQAVRTEMVARSRLNSIVNSSLRNLLGRVAMESVLSKQRADLMRLLRDNVNDEAQKLGIEIVDVRIKRADLPEANSQAVFRRMQAEREREAREARARGAEEAQKIRADADRQRTVLVADATKQAEIIRGEGDAVRTRIYAEAFQKDPQFFDFYRSLQAYRRALSSNDTTMVLSPDSDFFRFLEDPSGRLPETASTGAK